MASQTDVQTPEPMTEKEECCAITTGLLTMFLLIVGSLSYIVVGIIYLIEDHDIWKDCKQDSALWPYALVSLIFFFNKTNLTNLDFGESIDDGRGLLNILVSYVFELCLAVWGAVELFKKSKRCDNMVNSNLWKFSLATFILQTIYALTILIMFIVIYVISINKRKEKNQKKQSVRSSSI